MAVRTRYIPPPPTTLRCCSGTQQIGQVGARLSFGLAPVAQLLRRVHPFLRPDQPLTLVAFEVEVQPRHSELAVPVVGDQLHLPRVGAMYVVVSAGEHPEPDDWVRDQAQRAADDNGLTLGAYLGREDVLPVPRDPGLCCHVFTAEPGRPV